MWFVEGNMGDIIWNTDEIRKAIALVHMGAAKDRNFRNLCLSDPRAAIEKVTGLEVPADFSIKFIESDPQVDVTYLLPDLESDELNDNELAHVSGGRGNPIVDIAKTVCQPIKDLSTAIRNLGDSKDGNPSDVVCKSVQVLTILPGTPIPTGTGPAAAEISKVVSGN